MNSTKKKLQPLIGIAVSVILVYLVLFKPQFGQLFSGSIPLLDALFGAPRLGIEDLHQAGELLQIGPAIIAVIMLVFSLFIRAWRWRLIINQVGESKYWDVFHGMNVGYMSNNVLPLRAGELLRGIIVARRSNLAVGSLVTTVIVERIFDLAGLGIVFGATLLLFPFPAWLKTAGGILCAIVFAVLVICAVIANNETRMVQWQEQLSARKTSFLTKIMGLILNLLEGLRVLKSPKTMFHIAWSSLTLWALYISVMKLVLDAFQLTNGTYPLLADNPWTAAAAITIITSLGFAIPSAPGGVGTYHASVLLGLSWFAVPEGLGVVFAAVVHGVNYLTMVIAGVISLFLLKLKWSDIVKVTKKQSDI